MVLTEIKWMVLTDQDRFTLEQNRDPQIPQTLKKSGSSKKKKRKRIRGLSAPRRPLRVPGAQDG